MHWPLFGQSGKPTALYAWGDHPGEKRPPRKITSSQGVRSTRKPRSALRPDPPYGTAADGFLEKPPGERGNDDGRNQLEHFEGKACLLLRARGDEHDDRVVPQIDAVRAHAEPAKRRPADSHA